MTTAPIRKSFRIAKLKKDFFLNPFTLADDEWREEQWANGSSSAKLLKLDIDVFLAMLWRSIDDEGKSVIANQKIHQWDGMKSTVKEFDLPEEKLKYLLAGKEEILAAWTALIETLQGSNPDTAENAKKKVMEVLSSQTPKHSTSSPQSMDSQKNNSDGSQESASVS